MSDVSVFSDEQLLEICEIANVVACECPARLVKLLREVREFRRYTDGYCMERFPEASKNHQWLSQETSQIEQHLAQIVLEFMQREQLLDENTQLSMEKLTQRSYEAAMKQIEM